MDVSGKYHAPVALPKIKEITVLNEQAAKWA
jgi:hypothetical protein